MADPDVLDTMRAEWNARAREDANYYVAFGRREQDDAEFFATAADVVRALTMELKRLPGRERALEIGCGPGRLMRPMSRYFDEIHGIDVSDEMIRLAREKLRGVPNAYPRAAGGADLAGFPERWFDFVYSYAVFQHIPSREVVWSYLREAARVLKAGGILKCQLNGLPPAAARYTTWDGVRVSAAEVMELARHERLQLLALEGEGTQYLWVTMRRPIEAAVRAISNAYSGEAAVPAEGRFAAASLWIERLPEGADLNSLEVRIDGQPGVIAYIGPGALAQVNVRLPPGVRTGILPVDVRWRGDVAAPRAWMRVIPAGPAVPRIAGVTDGVNLLSVQKVTSGSVKLSIEELADPLSLSAALDETPVGAIEWFCTNPCEARYEFNFQVPSSTQPGLHHLHLRAGRRRFPPVPIEVA
jgi:ubiquinone/menaquinone biosynthesis C-methylase UbiE